MDQACAPYEAAILPDVLITHRIRRASHSRAMAPDSALRYRLTAQWDAARLLGPWSLAVPALAMTSAGYLLARVASRRLFNAQDPSPGPTAWLRGMRPMREERRPRDPAAKRLP